MVRKYIREWDIGERIILKLALEKLTGLVLSGFVWVRIKVGGGSDLHINEP
jgi:hypothetical protein